MIVRRLLNEIPTHFADELLVGVTSEERHSLPGADRTYLKMEGITGHKYLKRLT